MYSCRIQTMCKTCLFFWRWRIVFQSCCLSALIQLTFNLLKAQFRSIYYICKLKFLEWKCFRHVAFVLYPLLDEISTRNQMKHSPLFNHILKLNYSCSNGYYCIWKGCFVLTFLDLYTTYFVKCEPVNWITVFVVCWMDFLVTSYSVNWMFAFGKWVRLLEQETNKWWQDEQIKYIFHVDLHARTSNLMECWNCCVCFWYASQWWREILEEQIANSLRWKQDKWM